MRKGFSYRYKKPVKKRFLITSFFFALCFIILITRLFFLQIVKNKYYGDVAESSRTVVITLPPNRGLLLDRNLAKLAMSIPRYSVYAAPRYISDKDYVAEIMAGIFNKDKKDLLDKISNDKMFIWIERKLSDQKVEEIKSLRLEGVGFIPESERSYPYDSLAAHILGCVDIDNNGLEGIERHYDRELRGADGYKVAIVDAKRRQVSSVEDRFMPPRDGYNVVLTIDEVIQHIAEKALLDGVKKHGPVSASVVVMDPSSGGLLALCNWPTYDLNNYADVPADKMRNRVVADILEPGSSFKIVTASAVLEERAADPEDKFYCEEGTYKIAGRLLHDHRPHGTLKFKNIIEVSSNIGTVKLAQKLGEEKLYRYIRHFGFGEKTGIDLPGEVKGIVRHISKWSKGSIAAIPIGQEIAVTTLQLALAISCIANDGILMKPRVVQKMIDGNGILIKEFPARPVRRVMSRESCLKVREMLRMVVESGTGTRASAPGYSAAGKTGTGQRLEDDGSYSHSKFNSVFIGFAPVDDPKLAIAVVFVEPHPHYYGGTVAAPVFSEIAGKALRYMGVPPDGGA